MPISVLNSLPDKFDFAMKHGYLTFCCLHWLQALRRPETSEALFVCAPIGLGEGRALEFSEVAICITNFTLGWFIISPSCGVETTTIF